MQSNKNWTNIEDEYLINNYLNEDLIVLSNKLNRSIGAICSRLIKKRVFSNNLKTKEIEILLERPICAELIENSKINTDKLRENLKMLSIKSVFHFSIFDNLIG